MKRKKLWQQKVDNKRKIHNIPQNKKTRCNKPKLQSNGLKSKNASSEEQNREQARNNKKGRTIRKTRKRKITANKKQTT